MIVSLVAGVFELLKRPLALLPALVLALVNAAVFLLALEPLYSLLFDLGPGGAFPKGSLLELPYLFVVQFPYEMAAVILLSFFSLLGGNWLFFVYSYMYRKDKPLGTLKAMAGAVKSLKQILALSLFQFALGVVFLALTLVLSIALKPIEAVAAIGLLVWLVLGYYVYMKLMFAPIAMPFEGVKLREALTLSWKFTRGKILWLLLLSFVLSLITYALTSLGGLLSDAIEEEILSFVVLVLVLSLATAYANTVLIKYWLVGQAK